jgi:hypothetical protein
VGIEPTWDFSRGILSPLRLPFRHPGYDKNRPEEAVRTITSCARHGQTGTDSPSFPPEVGSASSFGVAIRPSRAGISER